MSKINYDLSKELCINEALSKTIKELKINSKNHPNSKVAIEQSIIPYLEQQIDCLKSINKYRMSLLKHFLYAVKRSTKKYELNKLDGTLKKHRRILLYALALGVLTATSSPSKESESLEIEEQKLSPEELHEIFDNIENTLDSFIEEQEKTEIEVEPKITAIELVKMIEDAKISECENYIEEYCYYFNFDSEKVLSLARTLTNNFSTEIIITIGNKEVISTDSETMAMFLVWDLYKNSSDYNLTREELTVTDEISHLEYDNEGNIILRNGLTFSQFMGKVSDSIEGDKSFDLAVSDFESDHQTNPQSIEKNNFGGWRYDEEYLIFPSPEAGIIYHCMGLEKIRNSRDYTNLSEFSGLYTQNDKSLPNPTWVDNVSNNIALIASNEKKYFDYEKKPQNKKERGIMLAMSFSK